MSIAEKLVMIRESKGYTRKRLSEELDIPYATITKYENGQRIPDHTYIVKIAQKFGVTTDFILGVHPQREKSSVSGKALKMAEKYAVLDEYGQKAVDAVLEVESARCANVSEQMLDVIYLPISQQPASAGTGVSLGPEAFDIIKVRATKKTRKAAFALRVSGDSMEPVFCDGDIALVSQDTPELGDIAVVSYQGDGYIKRVGPGQLVSENKKYKPIPIRDDVWVHGKVIGKLPGSDILQGV